MSGHLPISGPRVGAARVQARGAVPVSQSAGAGPTSLAQLISDLRLMLAAALARTQRQWDPTSGPAQEDAPIGPAYVDRKVMNARADIRAALAELDELRVVVSLTEDHPSPPAGVRPTPGSATAISSAACESAGALVDPRAGASSGPWEANAAQLPPSCAGATPATGAGPNSGLHDPERPTYPKPSPGFALPQPPRWSW